MGFSYKTSWLAVRARSIEDVADAVELSDRSRMGFEEGTERAYRAGIYVAPATAGWTLAHGARHLSQHLDASDPRFPARLSALSTRLGEVQFFGTHRVPEYHAWAWARDGRLIRAYCFVGQAGEVPLFVGEPTPAERAANVGTRMLDDGWERWTEGEWDAWHRTTPDESDVMRMAGSWSVNPDTIDDSKVVGEGLYGGSTLLDLT